MARRTRALFDLSGLRRTLAGGRAAGCWRRRVATRLAPLGQWRRGCTWVEEFARVRPRLRQTPLWGEALCLLAAAPEKSPQKVGDPSPVSRRPSAFAAPPAAKRSPAHDRRPTPGPEPAARKSQPSQPSPANQGPQTCAALKNLAPQAPADLLRKLVGPADQGAAPARRDMSPFSPRAAKPLDQPCAPRVRPRPLESPPAEPRQRPQTPAPWALEQSRVETWREQREESVRRGLLRAPSPRAELPPATSLASSPFADGKPEALRLSRGKAGGIAQPISSASPWRTPLAGPTLDNERLLSLATPVPHLPEPKEKTPARAPTATRKADGETTPPRRPAASSLEPKAQGRPSNGAPHIAQPTPFPDRSLGELLARARQRGATPEAFRPLAPAGPALGVADARSASSGAGLSQASSPSAWNPLQQGLHVEGRHQGSDQLDDLAEQIQRILQEQARRHGIDL
ncbi:hypothetical protein [Geoalkalibacter halelectricus]|uniref:Uncharacterized protein n=1 Tax=Geoalkalibacter halelectricus TaxID=2847045 RepID=A0ABY5ZST5_9BACT|nr:hypothetical protein [Geoalkalibacter halelectricus]MDO3379170.1 hypothetical protein [Geoalkalibacter halelectricus]UWZ80930.1 hypothetical protein L9S41_05870 [Geoalkalibacter halelectricus]